MATQEDNAQLCTNINKKLPQELRSMIADFTPHCSRCGLSNYVRSASIETNPFVIDALLHSFEEKYDEDAYKLCTHCVQDDICALVHYLEYDTKYNYSWEK